MLDRMKHKLKSKLSGEISITSDMQMIPPLWQKATRTLMRSLLMKEKESEKAVRIDPKALYLLQNAFLWKVENVKKQLEEMQNDKVLKSLNPL